MLACFCFRAFGIDHLAPIRVQCWSQGLEQPSLEVISYTFTYRFVSYQCPLQCRSMSTLSLHTRDANIDAIGKNTLGGLVFQNLRPQRFNVHWKWFNLGPGRLFKTPTLEIHPFALGSLWMHVVKFGDVPDLIDLHHSWKIGMGSLWEEQSKP